MVELGMRRILFAHIHPGAGRCPARLPQGRGSARAFDRFAETAKSLQVFIVPRFRSVKALPVLLETLRVLVFSRFRTAEPLPLLLETL
ncbi:hypothetical protein [Devosia sp.]|uniref:hypothetical protein n=1 Tax=Devosia sp. TaxID=1871048 RepID=UPI002AFDD2BA|nr:hypothetical protein [Devosia sp.]